MFTPAERHVLSHVDEAIQDAYWRGYELGDTCARRQRSWSVWIVVFVVSVLSLIIGQWIGQARAETQHTTCVSACMKDTKTFRP